MPRPRNRKGKRMSDLPVIDAIGFLAAGLVLATFCMRSMMALRWVAIASNVAFIAYAYLGKLPPILILHALLLPVNACRLAQLRNDRTRREPGARCRPRLATIANSSTLFRQSAMVAVRGGWRFGSKRRAQFQNGSEER
jgi:hypothetical protein